MSLYGDINSTIKSIFEFDRIYTSKKEMDESVATDGVLVNRFVLVSYENRIESLAKDNNITYVSDMSYEDLTSAKGDDSLEDYDNSIWVKKKDNSYLMVLNAKTAQMIEERKLSQDFLTGALNSYSDYFYLLAKVFGLNPISTEEIKKIWNDNFILGGAFKQEADSFKPILQATQGVVLSKNTKTIVYVGTPYEKPLVGDYVYIDFKNSNGTYTQTLRGTLNQVNIEGNKYTMIFDVSQNLPANDVLMGIKVLRPITYDSSKAINATMVKEWWTKGIN